MPLRGEHVYTAEKVHGLVFTVELAGAQGGDAG